MDLPDRLTVDLELLEDMDSTITIADLPRAEGVDILAEPEEVIARVAYQVEEEIEEEVVELELEEGVEPEVIERAPEEGEEEPPAEPEIVE